MKKGVSTLMLVLRYYRIVQMIKKVNTEMNKRNKTNQQALFSKALKN